MMTGMAMKDSVPVDERVMVKNGNRCPGADWGRGQLSEDERSEMDVGAVDPVVVGERASVSVVLVVVDVVVSDRGNVRPLSRWAILPLPLPLPPDPATEADGDVSVRVSRVPGVVVRFKMDEGGFEPESPPDPEPEPMDDSDWPESRCCGNGAEGVGGGDLSLLPRPGKWSGIACRTGRG